MTRVALFVDVQNIYYTVKSIYGCHFNYAEFWKQATADREVVAAYAYAIDRGDAKQRGFQSVLRRQGFDVKLKPFIQRGDGSAKGDWDVGITLDLVETAPTSDVLVLASGDGDFDMALDRVAERFGCSTEVYGTPGLTASSLIEAATRYVPIEESLLLR